jgi:hypothetical protein
MRAEAAEAEKLVEATELRGAARRRVRGCRRSVLEADLMLRLTADMFFDDDGQATVDPALCLFFLLWSFLPSLNGLAGEGGECVYVRKGGGGIGLERSRRRVSRGWKAEGEGQEWIIFANGSEGLLGSSWHATGRSQGARPSTVFVHNCYTEFKARAGWGSPSRPPPPSSPPAADSQGSWGIAGEPGPEALPRAAELLIWWEPL